MAAKFRYIKTIDAKTTASTSSTVTAVDVLAHNFHFIGSSITTGATITVQSSLDGSDWYTEKVVAMSADGVFAVDFIKPIHSFRVALNALTDGTYTVKYLGSND